MVFTPDAFWIVTTAKKGTCLTMKTTMSQAYASRLIAKYLESLKGGKTPIEILKWSKDQEQNAKQFEKCLELIKSSGVRWASSSASESR